ncbi:hypothetical protein DPMN_175334 [Dreissena polymorpha]|uniref:Uncharacterized protein n=1 Tax=Dreissena polymorpha TaxID=45954 RepID=A0A9D4E6D2_DREPO|nr:hypothetical protein DPMN_175334 [Dreissena polymorpha]
MASSSVPTRDSAGYKRSANHVLHFHKGEIRSAIKQLKNGKSAGPDSIPAEAL